MDLMHTPHPGLAAPRPPKGRAVGGIALLSLGVLLAGAGCGRGTTGPATTAEPPSLPARSVTWEGVVDTSALLKIRGGAVRVEEFSPKSALSSRLTVFRPLGPGDFPVVVRKEAGRGNIEVLQQGNRDNHYTLTLRVNDIRFPREEYYRFSVYAAPTAHSRPRPHVSLFAETDVPLLIRIGQDGTVVAEGPPGAADRLKCHVSPRFRPENPYRVRVVEGTGTVEVLPQDTEGELRVRVTPESPFRSPFEIELHPAVPGGVGDEP
ncbi:MAG: hypothetical protein KA419_20670 [Acidobacteria bacterium]|nr:hypothetical protein [Acidobacteriota bacterium]